MRIPTLVLGLCLPLLAACQPMPDRMDLPGVQKLTWFVYLDAADLTGACAASAPDRYRLIYNAHYAEQIRTYEVAADSSGGAALEAAVQSGSGIGASLRFISLDDPLESWRWNRAPRRLGAAEFQELTRALGASGAFAPAPDGLRLHSSAFYWVAAGCRAGQPFYHAWVYPSDGYEGLRFPDLLFALDETGVAVNPPRRRDPGERTSANTPPRVQGEAYSVPYFVMEVDETGLAGVPMF